MEDTDERKEIEEENNENVVIQIPFDPNDIKVSSQPLTLGDLIDRLEHKEIKLDTEFQRLPNLWNDTKKSRFIESLLLRLPIPTFYFDAQDDNLWRVIDGLQRVSTLKHFILDDRKLVLQNLEFLKEYEGKTFEELPRPLQRRIKTFPITVYIVEKGTPNVVKFNIFSRINQGGLVLTPQEIRHAIHQGIGADLVAELVRGQTTLDTEGQLKDTATEAGKSFVRATEGKIPSARMQDRDFSTRFVAFYLTPFEKYEPGMDHFMNVGMAKVRDLDNQGLQQLKKDFRKAMDTAWSIFGNDAFRKRFRKKDQRKPINKALFEVLSVSFAQMTSEECEILITHKELFKTKLMDLLNADNEKFFKAITYGTAEKAKVEQRFHDIQHIIKETLQYAA